MRRLPMMCALLALGGCQWLAPIASPTQPIDAALAGPLILEMADQHDDSVGRDVALLEVERTQALRISEQVRAIVRAAMGADQ